jgi:hypothetical protein
MNCGVAADFFLLKQSLDMGEIDLLMHLLSFKSTNPETPQFLNYPL